MAQNYSRWGILLSLMKRNCIPEHITDRFRHTASFLREHLPVMMGLPWARVEKKLGGQFKNRPHLEILRAREGEELNLMTDGNFNIHLENEFWGTPKLWYLSKICLSKMRKPTKLVWRAAVRPVIKPFLRCATMNSQPGKPCYQYGTWHTAGIEDMPVLPPTPLPHHHHTHPLTSSGPFSRLSAYGTDEPSSMKSLWGLNAASFRHFPVPWTPLLPCVHP